MRKPENLQPYIASHNNVTIVVGELSDRERLLGAVRTGVDCAVLLVGGDVSTRGTVRPLYPRPTPTSDNPRCSQYSMASKFFTRF